ncbi:MAG: prepilin-type N-terminal cleavage/methylation domain-containing protein [Bdellovibrionota bacterium]
MLIQKRTSAFTLVELMTVIVIIGILATVGLPQYQKYTLNAKMAEAATVLSGIQKSQITYQANGGYFMSLFRSTNQRPPGKKKAEYIDLTDSWQEIGYPVIAENDYYFNYSALAGGKYANGMDQVMGMGTETPIIGTWDGTTFITSRAIDAGNCSYTVDLNSLGLSTVDNEKWAIIFAVTDFVKSTPIVCTTFFSVVRMADTGLTVSPIVSLNAGS